MTIGIEHLPKGEEVSTRGVFEDALDKELKAKRMGRLLGGATGSRFGYIDLLIFDGERSVSLINKVLQDGNGPKGMLLSYFAKEKRKAGREIS